MSITHENEKSLWVAVALWLMSPALGLWYTERLKILPVFIIFLIENITASVAYFGTYTSGIGILLIFYTIDILISLVFLGWTIHAVKQFNANLKKSHT